MAVLDSIKYEIFCNEYVNNGGNARKAYQKAYPKSKDSTADVNGSKLLKNTLVKDRLSEIRDKIEKRFLQDNYIFVTSDRIDRLKDIYDNREITDIIHAIIDKMTAQKQSVDDIFIRKHISQMTRYEVLINAGGKCQLCGHKPKADNNVELHIDHIIPVTKGGVSHESNYQVLCGDCNSSKGNRYSISHG